ncbi:MAG TPA: VOC family protein [Nocardioides sp.]|nr:VOC family protein [Nocardioides sp.]
MYLENVVIDALEPQRLGTFWEDAVGGDRLTDEPDIVETRLAVDGGPVLDLCFQQVSEPPAGSPRLHLVLAGDAARLEALGAQQVDGPALADPEGNPCGVVVATAAYAGSGPLAALRLESADPDRDAAFWSWLTGWSAVDGDSPRSLRHPSGLGPVLELVPEAGAKDGKNRRHLDVRLEAGEDADAVAAAITERGGRELDTSDWGELPWRTYLDPSGNELCVLPASS